MSVEDNLGINDDRRLQGVELVATPNGVAVNLEREEVEPTAFYPSAVEFDKHRACLDREPPNPPAQHSSYSALDGLLVNVVGESQNGASTPSSVPSMSVRMSMCSARA